MSSLGTSIDKTTRSQIRRKVFELKKERQRLVKLLNIAKPASLPAVAESTSAESLIKNDEVTRSTESDSKTINSTSVTTVDKNTDSRHVPAAVLEEEEKVKTDKNSSKDSSAPSKVSDENITNLPERKQEFAVPTPPSLPSRKNRRQSKMLAEEVSHDKQTESNERTENSLQVDEEKQQGRKRVGTDALAEELIEKTQENNGSPKKKKKRTYGVPSQWEAISDPNYAAWMPPEGQTGDGKTHLNEKFGY